MTVSAEVYVRGSTKGFEEIVNHSICSNDRPAIETMDVTGGLDI